MGRLFSPLAGIVMALGCGPLAAGEVALREARFEYQSGTWTVNVTLAHADTGWDHYANAWRLVTESGRELASRALYHPHTDGKPFTDIHTNITIPATENILYVEACDSVHGWSKQRIRVDLRQPKGERYSVKR